MRRLLGVMLVFLGLGGVVASQSITAAMAAGPHGTLIEIDGAIQPVTARFLSGSMETATEEGAQLLIVRLDTPGGLFDSTRDIVESILSSRIPIVVYVAPTGSHAASAGTFIAAAAHVAAMAPVTNIGAASPVSGSGQDLPETLKSKATQDAAAFMRDIAKARGRNSEALEETVLSARSYSATEALDNNIIDLIAGDMDDLLAQLGGRTVQLDEGSIVLRTADLEVRSIQPTLLERFLGVIGNPNVAFLLLSVGTVLVFIETLAPGLLVPGITGGILLALAFVAMGNLPVNIAGIGLIFLSMALFYLEVLSRAGDRAGDRHFWGFRPDQLCSGRALPLRRLRPSRVQPPADSRAQLQDKPVAGRGGRRGDVRGLSVRFPGHGRRPKVRGRRVHNRADVGGTAGVGHHRPGPQRQRPGGQRAVDRRVRFGGGDRRGRRGDGGGGRRPHPEGLQGARDRRLQRGECPVGRRRSDQTRALRCVTVFFDQSKGGCRGYH